MLIDRPIRFRDSFRAVTADEPHHFDHADPACLRANRILAALAEQRSTSSFTATFNPELDDLMPASVTLTGPGGQAFITEADALIIESDGTIRSDSADDEIVQWILDHETDVPALTTFALVDDTGMAVRDLSSIAELAASDGADAAPTEVLNLAQHFANGCEAINTAISSPVFAFDGGLGSIGDGDELVAIITPKAVTVEPSSWRSERRILTTPDEIIEFARERVLRTHF